MIFARSRRNAIPFAIFLALFSLAGQSLASIVANTICEVQSGGSDTLNGGGFDPSNASMATDLAATSATGSSPVVTSATYNFVTRDNGAWLFIKSGTNWTPGWYQIASTSGNAATLTASVGSARLYGGSRYYGYAPFALNTAAGCATTTSPTGGTWSIDYSQGASPGITYTDMVIDGTTNTKYTSSANPVGPNIVGNMISVTSGTGFTVQIVQIASVSGTTATCDKSLGTLSSTGGHGGLGGAFASLGMVGSLTNPPHHTFIKNGTYTVATSSLNISGGGYFDNTLGATVVGYNTTRIMGNRDASRPTLVAGANSVRLIQCNGNINFISNIHFDNTGNFTGAKAVWCNGNFSLVMHCSAYKFPSDTFTLATNGTCVECFADTCTTPFQGSLPTVCVGCEAKNSSGAGFTGVFAVDCLSYGGNATGFINGVSVNCTSYNNTGVTSSGFSSLNGLVTLNCIADSNGLDGYGGANGAVVNSGSRNNATAATDGSITSIGLIPLSASPFNNAGTGDFSLNSTTGGGALLRGLSYPTPTLPGATTTNSLDIGAVQTLGAGSGTGGKKVGPGGGKVGILDPRSLFPFPRTQSVITRKAG